MKQKLKNAFRLILNQGYCELASGHISFRDPIDSDIFWIIPTLTSQQITSDNYELACVSIRGKKVLNGMNINFSGLELHSELYAARSDVRSIAHFHGPYTTAFSTLNKPLKICFQEACIFHNDIELYSDYDGLISNVDESSKIKECIGDKHSAILSNHGALLLGDSIESVCFRLFVLERTCWTILKCGYDAVTEINPIIAQETHDILASSKGLYIQFNNFVRNYEFSGTIR